MKKLLSIILFFGIMSCKSQPGNPPTPSASDPYLPCPPTSAILDYYSVTHNYYAPGSPYKVAPQPNETTYKINHNGNTHLAHDWFIHKDLYAIARNTVSLKPSGSYQSIWTNYGHILWDPAGIVNHPITPKIIMLSFNSDLPTNPSGAQRTLQVTGNPYGNQSPSIRIIANGAGVFHPCDPTPQSPYEVSFNPPSDSFNIKDIPSNFAEIILTPRTIGSTVNIKRTPGLDRQCNTDSYQFSVNNGFWQSIDASNGNNIPLNAQVKFRARYTRPANKLGTCTARVYTPWNKHIQAGTAVTVGSQKWVTTPNFTASSWGHVVFTDTHQ